MVTASEWADALNAKSTGADKWVAKCPAHGDKRASLQIKRRDDGEVGVVCFAGCSFEQILEATKAQAPYLNWNGKPQGVADKPVEWRWYDTAHGSFCLPVEPGGGPDGVDAVYPYRRLDDSIAKYKVRFAGKIFRQYLHSDTMKHKQAGRKNGPAPNLPYQLPQLFAAAVSGGRIWFTEGEKDADNLQEFIGETATTFGGVSNRWQKAYDEYFANAQEVIVVADNDLNKPDGNKGVEYAKHIALNVTRLGVKCKLITMPDDRKDFTDWRDAGGTPGGLKALVNDTPIYKVSDEKLDFRPPHVPEDEAKSGPPDIWDEPIPLVSNVQRPELSPDLLPPEIGNYACAVARTIQVPIDMAVLMSLAAVAVTVQRKFRVSAIPPSTGEYWQEELAVWVVCGAASGERKSPVFKRLFDPIKEWEAEERERRADRIEEVEIERDVIKRAIDGLKRKAGSAEDADRRKEIRDKIKELRAERPEEEHELELYTANATAEGMEDALQKQKGRYAVLATEGGLFDVLAGLYTKGRTNLQSWLSCYSGDEIRIKRQSRTAVIERPCLTMAIFTQTGRIRRLGQNAAFRESGFLGRFWYCQPESMVGYRDAAKREVIDDQTYKAYSKTLRYLLDMPMPPEPTVLELDPEALALFDDWSNWIEIQTRPDGLFRNDDDWANKLAGSTLRIAGLFHLIQYQDFKVDIDGDTMAKAIRLTKAMIPHALYSFSTMSNDPIIADAKTVLEWIERHKDQEGKVSYTELHRQRFMVNMREHHRDEVLKYLSHKWLIKSGEVASGRGRPKKFYYLNPKLEGLQDVLNDNT